MDFTYLAEFAFRDGSSVVKDMEEPGWVTQDMLDNTVRISIVPKEGAATPNGGPLPIVVVPIPNGSTAIIKSRVVASLVGNISFRCFGIGYKTGDAEYWTWVLPTGDIEVGDSGYLSDALIRGLKSALIPHG